MPATAELAISNLAIDPAGVIPSGTPVNVSLQIDFIPSGDETFLSTHDLWMSTDLKPTNWTYSLVLDGMETPQPVVTGGTLGLSGWILSYPADQVEKQSITLHMQGDAPLVQQAENSTIIEIHEIDSHTWFINRSSPVFQRTALVINASDLTRIIGRVQSALSLFRIRIDELSAKGVNTTGAEEKYQEAYSGVHNECLSISCLHPDQYRSIAAAESAITEGESILDKAWAEKAVEDAGKQLVRANETIDSIQANLSRPFDEGLSTSYLMRDRALYDIARARDNISRADFPQARIQAEIASGEAEISYNKALDAENRMANPLNSLPVPVIVPVFALLGAAYILIRRGGRQDR